MGAVNAMLANSMEELRRPGRQQAACLVRPSLNLLSFELPNLYLRWSTSQEWRLSLSNRSPAEVVEGLRTSSGLRVETRWCFRVVGSQLQCRQTFCLLACRMLTARHLCIQCGEGRGFLQVRGGKCRALRCRRMVSCWLQFNP